MLKHTKSPEKVVKKARMNFSDRRLPWIKLDGLRLIGRTETFSVNEESGLEETFMEVKYLLKNSHYPDKLFEICTKCDPPQINNEFYCFTLTSRCAE